MTGSMTECRCRRSLAACLGFVFFACASGNGDFEAAVGDDSSAASNGRASDPRFAPLVDALFADLERSTATGASVAIWSNDEIVWVGGFGTIDLESKRVANEETLFMIGSDTKKISAILYLQEVSRGNASLDETLAEALPELNLREAPALEAATARHLLSQTSGVVDWLGPITHDTSDSELESIALGAFAAEAYSLAPPGIFHNYSNPNFSLIGLLTQTRAGRAWPDIAEQRLFRPLAMSRTVARKADVDGNHAVGNGRVDVGDTTPRLVPLDRTWESAFVRPAGLVWSTPSDQMRLARFLVDGNDAILPREQLEALRQPQTEVFLDLPERYGFGLFLGRGVQLGARYHAVPVWFHGGNTLTHTSTFYVLPEQRFAISILSNGYNDDFSSSVATAIATLVPLPPASAAPVPPFDPLALDALTGSYVDEHRLGTVRVGLEGNVLTIEVPTLDEMGIAYERTMTRISTRVWSATVNGGSLLFQFVDGPDGETYFASRVAVAVRQPRARTPIAGHGIRTPRRSRSDIVEALARARMDARSSLILPAPTFAPR